MRHETPNEVVHILEKYIPKHCRAVLEPSVGKGALLTPFSSRNFLELEKITAVDINDEHLEISRKKLLSEKINSEFKLGDFLELDFQGDSFDCVIMNPPFSGKSQSFLEHNGKRVPIERAFFEKCFDLLRPDGRIIAVLPSSLIAGSAQVSFRRGLFENLAVRKVYELNRYTFPTIEGRFYVLVADKLSSRRNVVFEKPFSNKTAIIKVPKVELSYSDYRLDFSYYFSQVKLQDALERDDLDWVALDQICHVVRGSISAPKSFKGVVHTNRFRNGFWDVHDEGGESLMDGARLEKGDLIVKRVSRNCHNTFGIYDFERELLFSDCVLRIRPMFPNRAMELLFALRVIYSSNLGKQLLLKGSGANYISVDGLSRLNVPVSLASKYKREFNMFKNHYKNKDFSGSAEVEKRVHESLFFV